MDENIPNDETVARGVQGEMQGVDGIAPGQAHLLSGGTKGHVVLNSFCEIVCIQMSLKFFDVI